MTIAMCYLSPEGVVLGADSTSSLMTHPGVFHFFNNNQKLFQLGEKGTVGVITWGLGGLGALSYRSLLANLHDYAATNNITQIHDIAIEWTKMFQKEYSANGDIQNIWSSTATLRAKTPYIPPPPVTPGSPPSPIDPGMRTEEEEKQLARTIDALTVGFCFGGYDPKDRTPAASYVIFGPTISSPTPDKIPMLSYGHWGVPNMIKRLIWGYDEELVTALIASGKWSGTPAELDAVLANRRLAHATLPIRDVIDFVHTCIYSTIKAMKFSNYPQVCGGPIEIAVITTDRAFRWVKHKPWNAAIVEGEHRDPNGTYHSAT